MNRQTVESPIWRSLLFLSIIEVILLQLEWGDFFLIRYGCG
jgi:hypothetical protein